MPAGGFKTFVAGEILTSADTNDFLMQGVLVFDDATARDAAITSPVEGQFVFRTDEDVLEFFDGTDFVPLETGVPFAAATGGDTTGTYTSGGFTFRFHTFIGNGTLTVTKDGVLDFFLLGGGGGGGSSNNVNGSGGGGAGGGILRHGFEVTAGAFSIVIGAGGAIGAAGGNSTGLGFTANGGGRGGGSATGSTAGGQNGGCGGGTGNSVAADRLGKNTAGEVLGGCGGATADEQFAGGGGGVGAPGGDQSGSVGGSGGTGISLDFNGTPTFFGGGGGGGTRAATPGTGGAGGGGNGSNSTATAGTNGLGGGGGGSGQVATGAAGGSGVFIARYRIQ